MVLSSTFDFPLFLSTQFSLIFRKDLNPPTSIYFKLARRVFLEDQSPKLRSCIEFSKKTSRDARNHPSGVHREADEVPKEEASEKRRAGRCRKEVPLGLVILIDIFLCFFLNVFFICNIYIYTA